MNIFFKLKNIENLEYEDQMKIIKKYVLKYCKFQDNEIVSQRFIRHIQQKNIKVSKDYAVGCYTFNDKITSEQLNTKLQNPVLYEHFDVFVLL